MKENTAPWNKIMLPGDKEPVTNYVPWRVAALQTHKNKILFRGDLSDAPRHRNKNTAPWNKITFPDDKEPVTK